MKIASFNPDDTFQKWLVINDGVMGGMSRGKFMNNPEGFAVFEGKVSLANNGGFTMVKRTLEKFPVHEYSRVVLHVKGDGKRYQFRLKPDRHQMHSYVCHFETSGEWEEISIAFEDLLPAFRGRKLDMHPFLGTALEEFGILIGNRSEEEFRLLIKEIRLE